MNVKTSIIPVLALALLFSLGISNVQAQEQTDEEILEEYHRMFGNSTTIEEGDPIMSDSNVVRYAPLGEITNDIKIDAMRSLEQSKLDTEEFDKFVEKQVKDRKPLLDTVSNLIKMMEETDDPTHKAILKNSIDELKPLMAEHGMFLNEDKRDRELIDIWIEKSEVKQESFDPFQKIYHMIHQVIQWFQGMSLSLDQNANYD